MKQQDPLTEPNHSIWYQSWPQLGLPQPSAADYTSVSPCFPFWRDFISWKKRVMHNKYSNLCHLFHCWVNGTFLHVQKFSIDEQQLIQLKE